MISPADMIVIGAAALLFFGPDQLPKVARRAGALIRDVQNTSQTFIREMERAADESEAPEHAVEAPAYPYRSYAEPRPVGEDLATGTNPQSRERDVPPAAS